MDSDGLQRQLAAAQEITHMGSWEWNPATNVVQWSDELYRIYGLVPRSCEITFESFLSRVHPDDRATIQANVGRAMERGGRFSYRERIVRPDGSVRHLDTIGEVLRDEAGRLVGLIGTCRDVTEETRARTLRANEQRILEMIASAVPLQEVLTALILTIEEHAPPTIGSILLVEDHGKRVRHAAAPNLPEAYARAIDGSEVGPCAGSCGTAAYRKEAVFVSDIATDPLWSDYHHLALPHGLRACWSTPILSTGGRVLGTFALYYREPRVPTADDIDLISRAGHLAGIAIERRQLEEQLRALSGRVETILEDERTGIAREIHDELGQSLTALRIDVAWLNRRLGEPEPPRPAMREKLGAMSEIIDHVIDQTRKICAELRPGVLDDLGLVAAIEWQAEQFQQRTGTVCAVQSDLGDARFERNLSTAVFRIFQEALTNVARHADATRVDVQLTRTASTLRLAVRDDGRGISAEDAFRPNALGLLGIRERARRLGGTATIGPADGGGTVVVLSLPI